MKKGLYLMLCLIPLQLNLNAMQRQEKEVKRQLFEPTSPSKPTPESPARKKTKPAQEEGYGTITESEPEWEKLLARIPHVKIINNESNKDVLVTYPSERHMGALAQKIVYKKYSPQPSLQRVDIAIIGPDQKITIAANGQVYSIIYNHKKQAFEAVHDGQLIEWKPAAKNVGIKINTHGQIEFETL